MIACLQCVRVRLGGSCLQFLTLNGDDNILVLFNVKSLSKGTVSKSKGNYRLKMELRKIHLSIYNLIESLKIINFYLLIIHICI